MASRNKILKQVDRLAARGNHADAAETLLTLVEKNPRDVTLLNKAGDLYVRAGLVDDAVKQFDTIASFFKEDGFLLKAIAIYKKINKLDPSRVETYLQLGELYAERGLKLEAKQNLMRAAEGFTTRGSHEAARTALERLEKLDPDDSAVRDKLVDLLEEGGDTGEAATRHLDTASEMLQGGRADQARDALEKALTAETDDPQLLCGMADLLLQTGDAARAAELLDRALPSIEEPGLEYLLLLGRAKRKNGDLDGARPHLDEALKIEYGNDRCHLEMALWRLAGGDSERAFEQCRHVFDRPAESRATDHCLLFLNRFLDVEPFHPQALRELAIVLRDRDDEEGFRQTLSRLAGACHQTGSYREELRVLEQLVGWASGDAAEVLDARRQEAEVLAAGQTDALDESLVDFLSTEETPLASPERHVGDPGEELIQTAPPPASANGTARVVLGEDEEKPPSGETEIELVIDDEPLPGQMVEESSAAGEQASETVAAPDAPAEAAEPATEEDATLAERITATRVFLSYGMFNKALGQVEELLAQAPTDGDVLDLAAKIYMALGREDDAGEMRARASGTGRDPKAPVMPAEEPDSAFRASWMSETEPAVDTPEPPADEPPADKPSSPEPPQPTAAATPPKMPIPDVLAEDLEEVDFFISQGFVDEARDLVQGLLGDHPDHPRLLELLAQVGGERPGPAPAAPPATPSEAAPVPTPEPEAPAAVPEPPAMPPEAPPQPAETPPDAQEGTPLDDEQLSAVFSQFQAEVAGQVDEEDFGTHYDLGIAYKEMMLVDEAIGEFQIAARSTERRLDCCVMLGACFMEKGMPGEAIKWFEKGISTAETGTEESKGLQYDLAAALEADGATDKALAVFQGLSASDGQYRDVAARIERLQST